MLTFVALLRSLAKPSTTVEVYVFVALTPLPSYAGVPKEWTARRPRRRRGHRRSIRIGRSADDLIRDHAATPVNRNVGRRVALGIPGKESDLNVIPTYDRVRGGHIERCGGVRRGQQVDRLRKGTHRRQAYDIAKQKRYVSGRPREGCAARVEQRRGGTDLGWWKDDSRGDDTIGGIMRPEGERKTYSLLRRDVEFLSGYGLELLLDFGGIGCFRHILLPCSQLDLGEYDTPGARAKVRTVRQKETFRSDVLFLRTRGGAKADGAQESMTDVSPYIDTTTRRSMKAWTTKRSQTPPGRKPIAKRAALSRKAGALTTRMPLGTPPCPWKRISLGDAVGW